MAYKLGKTRDTSWMNGLLRENTFTNNDRAHKVKTIRARRAKNKMARRSRKINRCN